MCEEAQIISSSHLFGGNLLSQSSVALRLHYVTNHNIPLFLKFVNLKPEIKTQIHLWGCWWMWFTAYTNFRLTNWCCHFVCQSLGVHDAWLTKKGRVYRETERRGGVWTCLVSVTASVCKGTWWKQFKKDVWLPLQYLSSTTFYSLHPVHLNGGRHWKVNGQSALLGMCHFRHWLTIFHSGKPTWTRTRTDMLFVLHSLWYS